MKQLLYTHQNHSQRMAFAGLLLILLPIFFPRLFGPLGRASPALFSEWNAPKPRHLPLLKAALTRHILTRQQSELWSPLPYQGWIPCSGQSTVPSLPKKSGGYIQVFLDGGLNQQRMGICDAVAVAKILNATLVIPHLEVNPVWQDSSYGIVAIAPFSHRLAFDKLPTNIQRLRCKVNFEALVFVPGIKSLGDTLVHRLRYGDSGTEFLKERRGDAEKVGSGKFVVLHLRFDKDMAAHSACDFGGGKAEKLALAKYRQVLWQGRVLNSQFSDEELRSQGRCPLTPEEIGLLLAALGFSNSTRLYLASHKVYGGEARISTLKQLFPMMEDKKSLASAEELVEVEGKASLLAAVDYYVSLQSNVFISASPGNMHNALVGHRAYLNLKTIRPNMVLLGPLFLNKSLEWSEFQLAVVNGHKSRQGQIRLRKEKQSIYTYPVPDCMCQL
ncbi:O-fucosyltransferase 31 isoform X2 [Hevea brasiliensis]|uniref:O-fucosyltransferase 31 isoform X2 n=1 Tax=Hevea brasiliensis TaxID=3981 RepID=UPI000B7755C8|nr:O-fucosyltransferase 31 isoform X2 [Hevea brasiliensis]